jgi:glycosyltransferase involved in cell wall biosynthesis
MANEPLKKILMFTRPLAEPWDEASKNLAYEIAKQAKGNLEFHLLTTKQSGKKIFQACQNSSGKKIVPEEIYEKVAFGRSEKIALLKKMFSQKDDLDLIHFLFTPRKLTSLLIRTKLRTLGAKSVQTIATINEELYHNPSRLKTVLFADKIIAQSNFTKSKLLDAGIEKVELIYPGIDFEKFSPQPKDDAFMLRHGIKKSDFVVLYAGEYGRLDAMENVLSMIVYALKQKPKELGMKFVIACRLKSEQDKLLKDDFIEKMAKMGYAKHIVPLDFCDEMAKLYNMADVQVFPVRKMAGKFDIPFVLIEQMACKKPLVVSDLDVLKEFVHNDKTGFVIDRNSGENFGKAILELAQNRERLQQMGAASLDYANQNFDIRNVVKKYEDLYLGMTSN